MIKGTIVKRLIRGKERFYHQWRENGKTMSRYLKPDEIIPLREALNQAKAPPPSFRVPVLTGRVLDELAAAVVRLKPRTLFSELSESKLPLIILLGSTGSGKTTLLYQAIAKLSSEERAQAAYLSCPINLSGTDFLATISSLYEQGIRRFHIDALERAPEIENLLPALADTYAPLHCTFICASEREIKIDLASALILSTSPLSYADFVLLAPRLNLTPDLDNYLDHLGLAADVKRLAPPLSPHLGAAQLKQAIERLRTTLAERMLKNILIREIQARRTSPSNDVFTLELPHGGMDIVITDQDELTCELYEVKYSTERSDTQLSRLLSSRNLDQIEHRYGMITVREVLYLGRNAWHSSGVYYRNAAKFLLPDA